MPHNSSLGSEIRSLLSRRFFPPLDIASRGLLTALRTRLLGGARGRDRKTSVLSQAEGHSGAALEFLHHSWAVPDVAFPDPAGPCLLGINTEELCPRGGGERLVMRRTLGLWGLHPSCWPGDQVANLDGFGFSDFAQAAGAGVQNRASSPRTCPGQSSPPQ